MASVDQEPTVEPPIFTLKEERELYDIAVAQAEHHQADFLGIIGFDPEQYPAQRSYYLRGERIDIRALEAMAVAAKPMFPELVEGLRVDAQSRMALVEISEHLKRGGNVAIVTNHSELMDIAVAYAAVECVLHGHPVRHESAVIMGNMISVLGYGQGEGEKLPGAKVAGMIFDHVYKSFPKTDSRESYGYAEKFGEKITESNRRMTRHAMARLDEGRLILALAASGTTDKAIDEQALGMGRLAEGTIRLLQHENTLTVPMAVWLPPEGAVLRLAGKPRQITTPEEANAMMVGIADTLNEYVSGRRFVYHG